MIGSGGKCSWQRVWMFLILLIGMLGSSCRQMPQYLSVCEVQGDGLHSPFLDQEVILRGLVAGIQQELEPEGVLIVDEKCPPTGKGSRGIFLQLEGVNNKLEVGDEIRVRGWVREQENETRLEGNSQDLDIISLDNPLPEVIDLGLILVPPLLFGYEEWEGQLVYIPQADLLASPEGSGRHQILPRLSPGPSNQLVCFQADSLALGLSWEDLENDPGIPPWGFELTGLLGWIRQDQKGYFLQLIKEPHINPVNGEERLAGQVQGEAAGAGIVLTAAPTGSVAPTLDPSATPSQTLAPQVNPSPTIVPTPTYYQVRLLISEIYPNPLGDEPGGEWIELYNPQSGWLLLNGIKIGDEITPSGSEGLLRFPDGYYLEGGKTLLIANQATIFEALYGFLPDFELENSHPFVPDLHPYYRWGRSAIKLSNSGDEVLILDPWDNVVDLVVYGKESLGDFSPPADAPREGHSLERYPPDQDQGQASDWREQTDPSPGKLDRSTPTPIITPTDTMVPSPSLSPSPGAPSETSSLTSTFQPAPTDPGLSVTPYLSATPSSPSTAVPTTAVLTPSSTVGTPVIPSPTVPLPSPVDTRTPSSQTATPSGEVTPSPEPTRTGPLLIINEILADPDPLLGDSNGDGQISHDDDEFIELVNLSGQPLEISGWQVFDGVRLRYTFPEGSLIAPNCGLVLFGGGSPAGGFGGSLIFTAGSLGLNNGGDLVTIRDQNGQEITSISYGSEGNQDQSLTRNPDLSNLSPLVLHGLVGGSSGTLFSPGTKVDGSLFGVCP